MSTPEISVLLPVYNCEKYIGLAIQSMLDQTFTNFELIILNDGSTDNTLAEINKFNDKRIVLLDKVNEGITATLNKGIDVAKGKYIARMDGDDISMPERLQKQYDFMETHPDITLTDTLVIKIDEEGKETKKEFRESFENWKDYKKKFIRGTDIFHPTIMIKGNVLRKYRYTAKYYEDYFLFLLLINDGHKFYKIPEYLLCYRESENSIINKAVADNSFIKKVINTKIDYVSRLNFGEYLTSFNISFIFYLMMNKLKLRFKKQFG